MRDHQKRNYGDKNEVGNLLSFIKKSTPLGGFFACNRLFVLRVEPFDQTFGLVSLDPAVVPCRSALKFP